MRVTSVRVAAAVVLIAAGAVSCVVVAYWSHISCYATATLGVHSVANPVKWPVEKREGSGKSVLLDGISLELPSDLVQSSIAGPNGEHAVFHLTEGTEVLVTAPRPGSASEIRLKQLYRVYTASPREFSWYLPESQVAELREALVAKKGACRKDVDAIALTVRRNWAGVILFGQGVSELEWTAGGDREWTGHITVISPGNGRSRESLRLRDSILASFRVTKPPSGAFVDDLRSHARGVDQEPGN